MPNIPLRLGFFDGLHKGHQTVIEQAIEKAEELTYTVSSYDIQSTPISCPWRWEK